MQKLIITGEKLIIAPITVKTKRGILITKNSLGETICLDSVYFAYDTGLYYYECRTCEVKNEDGNTYKSDMPINFLSGQSIGTLNDKQVVSMFGNKEEKTGYFADIKNL